MAFIKRTQKKAPFLKFRGAGLISTTARRENSTDLLITFVGWRGSSVHLDFRLFPRLKKIGDWRGSSD